MRIAFRADGSPTQGTGHVMRCVTLAATAKELGHEPMLVINHTGVDWLEEYIVDSQLSVTRVEAGVLSFAQFRAFDPDRAVIDSYVFTDAEITEVAENIRTAVIVDFNTRHAPAAVYIDPNLGGVAREPDSAEWLAGSGFAMIRESILRQRDSNGADFDTEHPTVLVFVGGSDPLGLTAPVVNAVAAEVPGATIFAVGTKAAANNIDASLRESGRVTVVEPGQSLPELMGRSDVIVCAAGTSAWDVSAIGKPAVFLGIVDNQMVSIDQIRRHDLGPVVDATALSGTAFTEAVRAGLREILSDEGRRAARVTRMTELFDGLGSARIINALVGD